MAVNEFEKAAKQSRYLVAKGNTELAAKMKYWNDADFYSALELVHDEAVENSK